MIWADPPQGGDLANVYPSDGAGDTGAIPTEQLDTFIAQTPGLTQASQWQWSTDETFALVVHDTGTVLYEPIYKVYNSIDPSVKMDESVVGGDTLMVSSSAYESGNIYWRVRFQMLSDSTWTDWTEPTRFVHDLSIRYKMGFDNPGTDDPSLWQYDAYADIGYYGVVPADDFISGLELASLTGFTSGIDHNSDAGWLKFYVGPNAVCNSTPGTAKCLYIAKKSFKSHVSGAHIENANLRLGTRMLEILGQNYNIRSITGITNNTEWTELMYRVHEEAPLAKYNFESFNNDELNIVDDNGVATWIQEKGKNYYVRGSSDLTTVREDPWRYIGGSSSDSGWRPVLEFVDPNQ